VGVTWTSVWDSPRPHVHPLTSPAGVVLTSDAPADHPWHHGMWFTIKYLNGVNFWEEYGEYGRLEVVEVETREGRERASIDWIAPDGSGVAAREKRAITHVTLGPDAYALDWDIELVPAVDTVFDRTPYTTWGGYSGLTLRGAPDWTETKLRVFGYDEPRDRVLGDIASPWCTLANESAGVVMMDHPKNPRHPTLWYGSNRADTYGQGWANFLNAAFLWDGPIEKRAGETLHFRYRVVVHDGVWSDDRIGGAYHDWRAR
jgi:hypothetical protein